MNRSAIRERIIFYLNQQDTFSMPYKKLEEQFPGVGANLDVTIARMDGVELGIESVEPFTVTLKEPFREKRR